MKILRFQQGKKNFSAISDRALRDMNMEQEILALHSHFKELIKVLQDTRQDWLPWYIILGGEECGKTTWLTNGAYSWNHVIPSVFALQSAATHSTNTPQIHPICARVSDEGVFIEVPGRYLEEKNHRNGVWETFLKLLKKNKFHTRLKGIVLVLSLEKLSQWSSQRHQDHIYELKNCLQGLSQTAKAPLHLQILFSKVDTIVGFNEFFSETLQEERSSVFGIEFPEHTFGAVVPASQIFNEQFSLLLAKLNERVITLLHRERIVQKKALIADFPQQFSAFKALINRYICDLNDMAPYKNKILLSSLYFFSNLSTGQTEDQLAKLLSIYELPARVSYQENRKPKSYFLNHLVKKIGQLKEKSSIPPNSVPIISKRTGLMFLIVLTFFSLSYLTFDFYQKTRALNLLQKDFSGFSQKNISEEFNQSLFAQVQSLAYLNHIISILKSMPMSFLISFHWHPLHALQEKAINSYQEILQRQFVPLLTNSMSTELLKSSAADLNHTYSTLKAYLLLKNPEKNSVFLTQWLQGYLVEQKAKNASYLSLKVGSINFTYWPAVQLDESAIIHAQNLLNHLPKPLLAYLILKGETAEVINPFPVGFDNAFVHPYHLNAISAIYTQEKIVDVYFSQIPASVKSAFSGNAVLGKLTYARINERAQNSLIEQVRAFYLMDYVRRWENILTSTEVKLAHDYSQVLVILNTLTKNGLLEKFLKDVVHEIVLDTRELTKDKTAFEQKQFYDDINRYFQGDIETNRIFLTKNFALDKTIQVELLKIKKTLEKIAQSPNSKKASFDAAVVEYRSQSLFSKLAKAAFSAPPPLSRWLISLISNDWLIILQQSHEYVDQAWQVSVLSEYRGKLAARYPLAKQATTDIELADFAHFFWKDRYPRLIY